MRCSHDVESRMKTLLIAASAFATLVLAAPAVHAQSSYDDPYSDHGDGDSAENAADRAIEADIAERDRQVQEDDAIRQAKEEQAADDQLQQSYRDQQRDLDEQRDINNAAARARDDEDYDEMIYHQGIYSDPN